MLVDLAMNKITGLVLGLLLLSHHLVLAGLSSTLGSFADKELTLMRGVSTGVSNVLAFAFYGILIYGASKRDILQRDFNYSLISAVVYALLQQASVYQYTAVTPLANLAQSLLVGHNLYRIKMFTPITALFKKK